MCIIFISVLSAQYTNRLPTTLTLKAGENKTEDAIADCSSVWECTFGYKPPGGGYDFTYSTSGNGSSTLTLNLTLPPNPNSQKTTTPFYMNNTTINPNSNLVLNGFNSILLEYKMSITNASLTFNGANSTTIFQTSYKANVVLSNNATLKVSANRFLNQNKISISNSTLDISATSVFSYNDITNNGGKVSINGNFYNVGQKEAFGAASPSSVANFTNNDGTVAITGDVLNGGQLNANTLCQISGCGGGNIIINGGTVSVGGKLISEGKDGQKSSIQIYGGTLSVSGGLYNKNGSTLTFGIRNGIMGKLQGNLTNENGVVKVDLKGISTAGTHQIITGTITGLNNVDIINPNPNFLTATYNNGTVTITDGNGDGSGSGSGSDSSGDGSNDNKPLDFNKFKNSLDNNKKGIANALSSKFGGDLPLLTNVENIETAIATTDKAIKESFVAQPQTMISALQSNALPLPVPKRALVSRRTVASEIIRFDNGKRVSPFAKKVVRAPKNRNFYFNPLGAILRAENLTGYIAGFTLGTSYEIRNYASQVYFAYAYGASSQDFDTQSTDTTGNLFQFGFLHRYSYGILELEANANLLAGVFELKNEWAQTPQLNSTANFGDYQVNLGFIAGAKLGKRLSFKPFAGIQNYFELRDDFKQKGGLQIKGEGYNAYIVDGVLGIEGRYIFDELASIFGKFSFEERLLNTHKEMLMWAFGNELKYDNESYKNALSVSVGTQILTWYDFNLDAELSYKHYNNGLNYFGGSLMFKYAF